MIRETHTHIASVPGIALDRVGRSRRDDSDGMGNGKKKTSSPSILMGVQCLLSDHTNDPFFFFALLCPSSQPASQPAQPADQLTCNIPIYQHCCGMYLIYSACSARDTPQSLFYPPRHCISRPPRPQISSSFSQSRSPYSDVALRPLPPPLPASILSRNSGGMVGMYLRSRSRLTPPNPAP